MYIRQTKANPGGRELAGIAGSNPAVVMDDCLLWMFVLSGRDFCYGPIPRPKEPYWVWCIWVWSWSLDKEAA